MQKRSPKGGTVAMNGEYYRGGEFLPSTEMPSQHRIREQRAATRKQEIEPYVWRVAPVAGQQSIYKQLAGTMGMYNRQRNTFAVFMPYVQNLSAEMRARAADLVERYNAGERWI